MAAPKLRVVGGTEASPSVSVVDVLDVLQRYATERSTWRAHDPATAEDGASITELVCAITDALDGLGWARLRQAATAVRERTRDERRGAVVLAVHTTLEGWKRIESQIRRRDESRSAWEARLEKRRVEELMLAKRLVACLGMHDDAFRGLSPRVVVDVLRQRGSRRAYGLAAELAMRCAAFGDVDSRSSRAAFKRAAGRRRSSSR